MTFRQLKEIAKIDFGFGSPIDLERNEGIPLLTVSNITVDGELDLGNLAYIDPALVPDANLLKPGDILFNWRNGSKGILGKSALFQGDSPFTFASFLYRVRPFSGVEPSYLHQYFKFLRERGYFRRAKEQANYSINTREMKRLEIAVPPQAIQARIIEDLEILDHHRRLQERNLMLALRHRQALVDHFFSSEKRLPGFSGARERRPLRSFVSCVRKKVGNLDAPCVGLKDVEPETGRIRDPSALEFLRASVQRFQAGDVLFAKLRPKLKKYYLAREGGLCSGEFMVLSPNQDLIDPRYLFGLVQSSAFLNSCTTTGTYPRTHWKYVAPAPWNLPGLAEQRAVCEQLEAMDEFTREAQRRLGPNLAQAARAHYFENVIDHQGADRSNHND